MKKSKKRLAIGAGICMAAGVVVGCIGFLLGGRPGFFVDASGIHSFHSETYSGARLEKTKLDSFSSIHLEIPMGDIHIIPSDNYYMEYQLPAQSTDVAWEVKDDELSMNVKEKGGVIGFNFFSWGNAAQDESYVNLYVPSDKVFDHIFVHADCGNVDIEKIEAKTMELVLTFGDLDIESFKGESFSAVLDLGTFRASHIASKNLTIQNDMGDVTLDALENIEKGTVTMAMGDFSCSYCKAADFKVTNDMGNVSLGMAGTPDDYTMDLATELGSVFVSGYEEDGVGTRFLSQNKDGVALTVYNDSGDISIGFEP